jgi:hypothetical protein
MAVEFAEALQVPSQGNPLILGAAFFKDVRRSAMAIKNMSQKWGLLKFPRKILGQVRDLALVSNTTPAVITTVTREVRSSQFLPRITGHFSRRN